MSNYKELNFLKDLMIIPSLRYRTHKYLLSDFDDATWFFDLSDEKSKNMTKIEFNIHVSDSSLLTDEKNNKLLNSIKYWIIVFMSVGRDGKLTNSSPLACRGKLSTVLRVIDYFILNDSSKKLSKYGFDILNQDDIKEFINKVLETGLSCESIYDFSSRCKSYIQFNALNCDFNIDEIEHDYKVDLFNHDIKDCQEIFNGITTNDMAKIKGWLLKNNLYSKDKFNDKNLLKVSHRKLAKRILGSNSLFGHNINTLDFFDGVLDIGEKRCYRREFDAQDIISNDDAPRISKTQMTLYLSCINTISYLTTDEFRNIGVEFPNYNLISRITDQSYDYKKPGRFKSAPCDVVFKLIEDCINFHLEYGDDLVTSYENLVNLIASKDPDRKAHDSSSNDRFRWDKEISDYELLTCLTPKISDMGCNCLYVKGNDSKKILDIRSNKGFMDLIEIYTYSTVVLICALGARRKEEILSMTYGSAIDKEHLYIIFDRAKATKGLSGLRDKIARPMEKICIDMISNIERMQEILINTSYLKHGQPLFGTTSRFPVKKNTQQSGYLIYKGLDLVCDYFETKVENGKRFYLRPHQFRRFFAQLYFWKYDSSIQSMDTLRYFLAHTDMEHLHNYITESTPGAVLKSVKAQYISEKTDKRDELVSLIQKRYGVASVELISSDELEEYIECLIEDGDIDLSYKYISINDAEKEILMLQIDGCDYEQNI